MNDEPIIDDPIGLSVADGIARVVINAPDKGNSLTAAMRDRLGEIFEECSGSLAVRVVLLTAAGDRHFCTGAQLGGAQPAGPERPEGAPDRAGGDASRIIRRGWQRLISSILDCEKPVIASVNGTAAGGGAQLAIACDFLVMSETAKLVEVFVRRGIMPDAGAAYLLPRSVGLHHAKRLMMLGHELTADEALRIGLAMEIAAPDELDAAATELAETLAALPTRALAMTKWLTNRSFESSRATAFEEEAFAQEAVSATDDAREGMLSFIERRPPEFHGW